MVFFPTASQLQASFNPNGARYWVKAPSVEEAKDKTVSALKKAEQVVAADVAKIVKPNHSIPLYSSEYYKYCTLGGILACGPTHASVTPLDLVKCRLQVDPKLYRGNMDGWRTIIRTEGASAIFTGFGATLIGYSLQGAGKYGLYEYFKKKYSDIVGEANAIKYKTGVYLIASASAEFFADLMLCPYEMIKVKTQTTMPPFAKGPIDGFSKYVATEGYAGLYKGLVPLWARQIPYTMVKFATFENTVLAIYSLLPKKKEEYSLVAQTGVSFLGGYIAGVFCAIVSHPADVMVSKINKEKLPTEGTGECLSRIYARIGFSGLWTGLGTRIIMVGTLTGLQWLIYDSFKAYVGLPTAGSAPPAEQK